MKNQAFWHLLRNHRHLQYEACIFCKVIAAVLFRKTPQTPPLPDITPDHFLAPASTHVSQADAAPSNQVLPSEKQYNIQSFRLLGCG